MATFNCTCISYTYNSASFDGSFTGGSPGYTYYRYIHFDIKKRGSSSSISGFPKDYPSEETGGLESDWKFTINGLASQTTYDWWAELYVQTPEGLQPPSSGSYTASGSFTTRAEPGPSSFDLYTTPGITDVNFWGRFTSGDGTSKNSRTLYLTIRKGSNIIHNDVPHESTNGGTYSDWDFTVTGLTANTYYTWEATVYENGDEYTDSGGFTTQEAPAGSGYSVYIGNGSSWEKYKAYIGNDSNWEPYTPHIGNESNTWD